MKSALLEIFLGYCKSIKINVRGSIGIPNLVTDNFDYICDNGDFIIYTNNDGMKKEIIIIPNINDWDICEYEDYIIIHNDDLVIQINEEI